MAEQKVRQKDVNVVREGTQIILPENMTWDEGIEWLSRKKVEDERRVKIYEEIDAFPLDGAFALTKALSRRFGWTDLVPTPGFFGEENPPVMIGVEVAVGKTVQVPWGRMQIPGVSGFVQTGITKKDERPIFVLNGECKKKHKEIIAQIADDIREIVRLESIYRGKAIMISFPDPEAPFDPKKCPKFMDVSNVRPEELIFSRDTAELVEVSLFTLIKKTDQCRKHGVPLKRGILLEGPYGTGKTLTAWATAKMCEENGWTFVYLDQVQDLKQAISFATQYKPAVVFAEDIDRAMEGEDRDEDMDAILNTIDGIQAKGSEILVILTTNHLDKVNQAMLRPGRLDTLVSVTAPDREAAQRLVRLYGRGLVEDEEDLEAIGERLQGQIPAVIREVVERSKLAAISRLEGNEELTLKREDLLTATTGMLRHLELLKPKQRDERTPLEKFGAQIGYAVATELSEVVQDVIAKNDEKIDRQERGANMRAADAQGVVGPPTH